jgi:hypothetical protein
MRRDVDAEAYQAPVCRSLHFNWTPFCLYRRVINSDLRKIRLAPVLPERDYCISRGMFVRYHN